MLLEKKYFPQSIPRRPRGIYDSPTVRFLCGYCCASVPGVHFSNFGFQFCSLNNLRVFYDEFYKFNSINLVPHAGYSALFFLIGRMLLFCAATCNNLNRRVHKSSLCSSPNGVNDVVSNLFMFINMTQMKDNEPLDAEKKQETDRKQCPRFEQTNKQTNLLLAFF